MVKIKSSVVHAPGRMRTRARGEGNNRRIRRRGRDGGRREGGRHERKGVE
jgi:hypothetical protein